MADKMREAFEKWAKAECLDLDSIDGFYSDNDTHIAWGAWQAAQSVPVECCGCHVEGNEYMGQVQLVCCGNPEPAGVAASVPVVGEGLRLMQPHKDESGLNVIDGPFGFKYPGTVELVAKPTHSITEAEIKASQDKAEMFDWLNRKAHITWDLNYENVELSFHISEYVESFDDLEHAVKIAMQGDKS